MCRGTPAPYVAESPVPAIANSKIVMMATHGFEESAL
jgi:hypothetical protein